MNTLLLLGGGGHCRSCIDVIESEKKYTVVGIVSASKDDMDPIMGYPILGTDDELKALITHISHALITIGQIKSPDPRMRLFNTLKSLNVVLPIIRSPLSYCSRNANIGIGSILMHGSIINANARVGVNCIINSQALIEHDAEIGDHCHISTGARVNGSVRIGNGTFIGSGAVLKEGIVIGDRVVIGAGKIVLSNVSDNTILKT